MSIDMNKTIEEASLDNLNDIIVPDAVGFFPMAPGWIIVGFLLLTILFHFGFKQYLYYKRSLYKREALHELQSLTTESVQGTVSLLDLAKRVGIAAYGRPQVAKLDGDLWWDFMEKNSKAKVHSELREEIKVLLYNKDTQHESSKFKGLKSIVEDWIKTHKVVDND